MTYNSKPTTLSLLSRILELEFGESRAQHYGLFEGLNAAAQDTAVELLEQSCHAGSVWCGSRGTKEIWEPVGIDTGIKTEEGIVDAIGRNNFRLFPRNVHRHAIHIKQNCCATQGRI